MFDYKTKLLATNYFIDNEYLNSYCQLVLDNYATKKVKYTTQTHHILPRCYFNLVGLPIDNSHSNLVELSHYDHALAHYYLCFCTVGEFKYKLRCAFMSLVNSNRIPEKTREALKVIRAYSDLLTEIYNDVGHHAHNYSDHRYINNGLKTKHVHVDELEAYLKAGWVLGNLAGKQRIGSKQMTDGSRTVFAFSEEQIKEYLAKGFVFGRLHVPAQGRQQSEAERDYRRRIMKGVHKNKVHINNGTICKFVSEEEASQLELEGWVRGRIMKSMKNLRRIN